VRLWRGDKVPEAFANEIRRRLKEPRTIDGVRPAMIRDPKDPCLRASTGPACPHFGLFAERNIPRHSVVCEYGGMVRREDEGGYNPAPEYAVRLAKCDEYVLEGNNGDPYGDGYLLDGEDHFNEGSLINDSRWSLAGEEDARHRRQNVVFLEVAVNGWPHTFIVTTRDVKKGEELLIDFGPDYWEKIRNQSLEALLREEKRRAQDLQETVDALRNKLTA